MLQFSDLAESEETTSLETTSRQACAELWLPRIITALFHLLYFQGPKADVSTPEGEAKSLAWNVFFQAPYSIRACYLLQTNGYYLEASFALRFLIEALVRMEYARKNPDKTSDVWYDKTRAGKPVRIQVKSIFSDIAPDLYDGIYGRLLSRGLHAKVGFNIFRVKRRSPTEADVVMGNQYDETDASYILNLLLTVSLAYLRRFPHHFPEGWAGAKAIRPEYDAVIDWLETFQKELQEVNPKTKKLFSDFGCLLDR